MGQVEPTMASVTKNRGYTFDDFCWIIREDQKADLIDGVIYMASPEGPEANLLFGWLIRLIADFVEVRELGGRAFATRVAFRLDDANGPEPDIAYIREERMHLIRKDYVDGPPDLAVEIVSPDSVGRDYEQKRAKYEEAGVTEYWIVDDLKEKILLLRLSRGGKYGEVRPKKGVLSSEVLPGFWLRPEWLWEQPRPKKAEVLQQILSPPR